MATTSMWDISLNTANTMYTWGSLIATSAAVIAAIAGVAALWGAGVRDKHSDQQIETARATAESARESAAKIESETEKLKNQNLELKLDLEKERIKRLELERSVGPRSLSPQEIKSIKSSLLSLQKKTSVLIHCRPDEEVRSYANQIATCLSEAGVSVTAQINNAFILGAPETGLSVYICHGYGAKYIENAILSAGIQARINHSKIDPKNYNPNEEHKMFNELEIAAYLYVYPKAPHI